MNVGQILEEVQMVLLNVVDDRNGGEEVVEGVAVFAALGDDRIALSDAVTRMEQRQIAADHHGRVPLRLHEDMRHHARRRGLAVRTRNADRVPVFLHDHAPGLGPLKDGDALCAGGGDLGIVVPRRGGADDAVRALDVFRPVADEDADAFRDQLVGGDGGVHI